VLAEAPPRPPGAAADRKPRLRLRIATFLSVALALLVAVPTLLVTAIGLGTALSNTTRLLDERSQLFREMMVARTRDFLAPAEALPGFVAQRLEREEVDPGDPAAVTELLRYAFGAAPQLGSVSYASEAGWIVTAFRRDDGAVDLEESDWRGDPAVAAMVADARAQGSAAHWGPPVFVPSTGMTVLAFVRPVRVEGEQLGSVVAAIRVDAFSRFVRELAGGLGRQVGVELFVLRDREQVLAHSRLARPDGLLSADRPVPLVGELGDPALAAVWREERGRRPFFSDRPGHILEVGGRDHAYFYERLAVPSGAEWLVGGYLPVTDATAEFSRLLAAAGVAALALLGALAVAVWLGRRFSRPAGELALASERIARLELDAVPELRRSHLAELDAAARAFNGMVGALRLFVRYAPAKLVRALLDRGEEATRSERRVVTVMFTDIAGFTAAAERMSAEEAAGLLNAHMTLVVGCVEAEGGTVDKLIGDGLMAFWNAPEPQPDHADRALRAALAIRAQIREANATAARPVRVRIGLHTGPAVVGNIGAPSRLSYTLVGDTVNVASRVEDANRDVQPGADVAVLLSGAVASALTEPHRLVPLGERQLRGREGTVELFTADPGAAPPEPEADRPAVEEAAADEEAPDELLAFWFGPGTSERWFAKDPEFDAELERRFGALAAAAAEGRLARWADTPRGALALVLLLDQLPRNLHRGTPAAFAQDARAREATARAIGAGFDAELTPAERLFLYLPFEHSEDPADQERAVELIGALGNPEWTDYAARHRDVIARFGRFPHRNAALGRASTPEEEAFLREPGSSF
jgi:adenylate cyclase